MLINYFDKIIVLVYVVIFVVISDVIRNLNVGYEIFGFVRNGE